MPKIEIVLKGRIVAVPKKQAKALVEFGIASYPVEKPKQMIYQTRALKAAPVEPSELAMARAEYEAKFDKKPFYGWGTELLRDKIAEAAEDEDEDASE